MAEDRTEEPADKSAGGASKNDVVIDTSEPSRGTQKVELDLDDAPFLEEEEEVKPEPAKPSQAMSLEPAAEEKPAAPANRKKLIIIGAAALVLLIVAGVAVKFLFFKGPAAPAPEKTEQAASKEANATPPEPEKPEIQVRLEPFWVEQKGEGDEIRFLTVRILLTTTDPSIAKEFQAKTLEARNAIFYYLKNKDVHFLADEHNTEKLKAELLLVINQYVSDGKFEMLMFEEYVVK